MKKELYIVLRSNRFDRRKKIMVKDKTLEEANAILKTFLNNTYNVYTVTKQAEKLNGSTN